MVQQDRWHLWSAGTQVQSPAQHSGLRIWCCCSYGLGSNCGSDQIPGPRTFICQGVAKKEKKKKKKRNIKSSSQTFTYLGMVYIKASERCALQILTTNRINILLIFSPFRNSSYNHNIPIYWRAILLLWYVHIHHCHLFLMILEAGQE